MKKQLIGLMLIMSSFAFAGGDKTLDLLEEKIELKHSYITDGTHKLKIDDIDIGVINGTPFVVIETDSLFTDKAWEEFNKKEKSTNSKTENFTETKTKETEFKDFVKESLSEKINRIKDAFKKNFKSGEDIWQRKR